MEHKHPPLTSHKRGIAETWRSGFQVPPPLVLAFHTCISLYRKYTHFFSRKTQDAFNMWSKSTFIRGKAQVKLRPSHFDVTIITALLFFDVVAQHDGYPLASCS